MRVLSSLLFASVKPFPGYHLSVGPQIWHTRSKSCEGVPFPQLSPVVARLQPDRGYTLDASYYKSSQSGWLLLGVARLMLSQTPCFVQSTTEHHTVEQKELHEI